MRALAVFGAVAIAASAHADVVILNPIADAFVDSAQPTSNYGGAGALGIAAPGSAQGEFQSLMRFDTSSAVSAFNASFGVGQWTIQSITLKLTSTAPNNAVFNAQAAGPFAASWMQNDGWTEGSGTPAGPTTTGITFATLPGFLGALDESIGSFNFGGGTSGSSTYSLGLTSGFLSDVTSGGQLSLRVFAPGTPIGYLFTSRNNPTVASRPEFSITAVPAPGAASILLLSSCLAARNRRRPF